MILFDAGNFLDNLRRLVLSSQQRFSM